MNICFRMVLCTLLVLSLGGCGYRFSGDTRPLGTHWSHVAIKMEGPGVDQNPVLAQQLKDRIRSRLAIASDAANAPQSTLRVQMQPTSRQRILEDSSGRSDQFELVIQVHLVLEEGAQLKHFPAIKGAANYYEPKAGASTDAIRVKAEQEALDQVVESLVAFLSTYP
ncbi:MAG: hypothetical protein HQL07_16170 [Nitrospirae bacterium]|nr:hypothetical protein [Magnetococcales bacterium]HAT49767.1 hypothetical protein [Alphaproteobacteria bacterium]